MEKDFAKMVSDNFSERIVCLLYYGSNAFATRNTTTNSDYDFCLVLSDPANDDLLRLRKIICSLKGVDVTLHYLNLIEERGWENFQHGNHGQFFMFHLASAKTLIGQNIFTEKVQYISHSLVADSLLRQIIEYFWRLDNWCLTIENESLIVEKFTKYLVRVAQDLMLAYSQISYREVNETDSEEFVSKYILKSKIFSTSTKILFKEFYCSKRTLKNALRLRFSLQKDYDKSLVELKGSSYLCRLSAEKLLR